MTSSPEIRHLSAAEVHMVVDWARQEGWNPGIHDAACFEAADPGGFLVSLHEGEPAATISVVRYGEGFAFLGLYICRSELRGRGYGLAVWNAGLAQAGTRTIGLDGVPEQQANYRRAGFALAWRNRRYEGAGRGDAPHAMDGIVNLDTIPFADIAAYDAGLFETNRERFLRVWIAQPGAVRLGVVQAGRLTGWGLMRPCADGSKIGPLVADDASCAEHLLDALLGAADAGAPVFLDVPETNAAAIDAAERRGMAVCFETARMYRGPAPALDLDRIWGITSFELG